MDVIIDGYNLIAIDRRLDRALEQNRNWLIQKLIRYQIAKPFKLAVVFDGWRAGSANETTENKDGISIVYSRLGEKADGVIIRIAREKSSGCVVISSDRDIRNAVERFGAVAIHAHEFSEILQTLDAPNGSDPFDDWDDRQSSRGNANRLSKTERRRREKLNKLRL
jgi:predicted RNA-binding protein with PIN domain